MVDNAYKYFLRKNFPYIKYTRNYDKIFDCLEKIDFSMYTIIEISNNKNLKDFSIILGHLRNTLYRILLYLPLKDSICIDTCLRMSSELFLKLVYYFLKKDEKSLDKVSSTSFRFLKDEIVNSIYYRKFKNEFDFFFNIYASNSNKIHLKEPIINNNFNYLSDILYSNETNLLNNLSKKLNNFLIYSLRIILTILDINDYDFKSSDIITLRKKFNINSDSIIDFFK